MTPEEKEALKTKIITDLFHNQELRQKIDGICRRNNINHDSYIHEDVLSETFYYLSRYNTDKMVEAYQADPKRLFGLAIDIAIKKGVAKHSKNPEYPKHSVATNLLFASNFGTACNVSSTEWFEDFAVEKFFKIVTLVDEDSENADYLHGPELSMWEIIEKELDIEEIIFLQDMMRPKGRKMGRYKLEFKAQRDALFEKIRKLFPDIKYKRMNQTELIETMGEMYALYQTYRKTGTLDFKTFENKMKLVQIYAQIMPHVKLDLGCDSCTKSAINVLASYYEREHLNKLPNTEPTSDETGEALTEETPAEPIKKGHKGKNK
ncbi:MAG: hypothetical protein ACJ749_03850 [Flavisolibacter sp.]